MGMKYGLGLQSNGTNEEKFPEASPVYADANDTDTRFYFTLERSSTGIKNTDEGDYVIPIPDNIYDKPEEDESLNMQDVKNGSQFYFTLEECSEENDKELSSKNTAPQEESKDSNDDIYDTAEETYGNGTQDVSIEIQEQDEVNDDDTYVINIPNNANGGSSESKEDSMKTTESKEMHVIEIPNDNNDLSSPEKGDEYSRRIGIKEDNNDGYLEKSGADNDNATTETRVNSRSEDEFNQLDSDEIYQNVSESLHTKIHGNEANKNAKTSEQNAVHSQENMGYLDDEIVAQNKTEQNGMDNVNCHKSYAETLVSDSNECLSDNDTKNDDECYLDDDIYENWEENIIGRLSGASREDLNELGDEVDPNKDFDIIKDQLSGCFYENLRHFRPLVPQDIR